MNPWRQGSLSVNPYSRTAFSVTRIPREVVRRKSLVQLIGEARRIVRTDASLLTVQGEPVTEAELNAAEQILLDPKRRLVEELLVHSSESPQLDRLQRFAQKMVGLLTQNNNDPLAIDKDASISAWAHFLVGRYLEEVGVASPSLGARELELIPPFGREGDE